MTIAPNTRFKKLTAIALLAACSLVPTARVAGQAAALIQDEPGGPVYVAGDLIIQLKPNTGDADMRDVERRGALKLVKHIKTDAMKAAGHPGVSRMRTGLPVRQAIAALKNHPAVEFAEPNWVYTHTAVSNDPYYTGGSTWGLYGNSSSPANQFGSQAGEAWGTVSIPGFTGSAEVHIGVIDEGIQFTHPDLSANVWTNPHDAVDGVDNDGNGYIDDIHGWDFFSNDNSIYDPTGDDHGTHVSGTIGAAGGNGLGVAGVNWNVTIISGKFLGPNGGTTIDAIEAVDYFTNLKARPQNAINLVALNNSWGGGGFSQALLDAIVRAAKAEILFIAAAGNAASNNDAAPFYPARYDTTPGAGYNSVIAVAAIQSNGALASFSNYGKSTVHLGAPGAAILSTVPTDGYASYSGTSMATPHVTGAAGLYASTHARATAYEIRSSLLGSTFPTASLANTVTGGRLDLSTIIAHTGPPPAPTGVAATPGDTQVTVAWNVTIAANSYEVKRSSIPGSGYTAITPEGGIRATSYSDTGLANGTTYYYVVSAANSSGPGVNSAEVFATPQIGSSTPPSAPSGLTATTVSSSQIRLTWADNSSNEDGFKIEQSTNNRNFTEIASAGADATTIQITGLSRNRVYYHRVRAHNSGGNSAYSNTATAKTLK